MLFTSDWVTWHAENWEKWYEPWKGHPCQYLEIGSYEGRSLLWMLDNVLTHPESWATVVDPWCNKETELRFNSNTKSSRFTKIKDHSHSALKRLPANSLDIIYIDGSHHSCHALEDGVLSWRLLKVGGVLVFDDYQWESTVGTSHRPKEGIDGFLLGYEGSYETVHKGYQVCIRKLK